jgi:hypothetical protein
MEHATFMKRAFARTIVRVTAGLVLVGFVIVDVPRIPGAESPSPRAGKSEPRQKVVVPPGLEVRLDHWKVGAGPTVFRAGDPTLVDTSRRPSSGFVPSPEPTSTEKMTPTVYVEVELNLRANQLNPTPWPLVREIHLLRAARREGDYKEVARWGEDELNSLWTGGSGLVSPAAEAKEYSSTIRFVLLDRQVEAGQEYFYRVRLAGADQKAIGESGICSSIAFPVPSFTLTMTDKGRPQVSWEKQPFGTAPLAGDPKIVMGLVFKNPDAVYRYEQTQAPNMKILSMRRFYELGRFPNVPGSFKSPLGRDSILDRPIGGPDGHFELLLEARVHKEQWDSRSGQSRVRTKDEVGRKLETGVLSTWWQVIMQRNSILVQSLDQGDLGVPLYSGVVSARWIKEGAPQYVIRECPSEGKTGGNGSENPGIPERCTFTFVWKQPGQKDSQTVQVAAVRNPLPTGLVALAGDGQVRLTWNRLEWDPKDWIEEPEVVVLRSIESEVKIEGGTLQVSPETEVFRGPANVAEYLDREVKNGVVYFYTLQVEGIARATSWTANAGVFPCNQRVKVRMTPAGGGPPVAVLPHPSRSLRISILSAPSADPRINSAVAHALRFFGRTPGIQLVERTEAPSLFDERQLVALHAGADAAANQAKGASVPADLILRTTSHRVVDSLHLDVWMDDFKNSRRERLISLPLENFDPEKASAALLESIAQRFPIPKEGDVGASTEPTGIPVTTAILGFVPLDAGKDSAVSPESMVNLITAPLSGEKLVRLVEREKIQKVIQELGLKGFTDEKSSLRAGHLLKADAIVSGYYGVTDGKIAITARSIDVETGALLSVNASGEVIW